MDLTNPTDISLMLKKYNIKVRKSWGQNFLTSATAVEGILSAASLDSTDIVLEVGPGLGVMTTRLLALVKEVIAVEIDPLLCRVIKDNLPAENLCLIQGDALEQDFSSLIPGPYKVVANLPYYITSPFLVKLIEEQRPPETAVLLVQLEVARRLAALPGTKDYGSISVLVQYHCDAQLVQKIGPGNFFPPPKVDSAVVRLKWRPHESKPGNEKLMFRIVRTAFSQRRKMLKGLLARDFGMETSKVADILVNLGLNGDIRGEKLSVGEFAALSDAIESEMS